MNREDCEKLLDVFAATALATRSIDTDAAKEACESLDSLRDVIAGIMADEQKPVYRDSGITVGGTDWWKGLDLGKVTTVPCSTPRVITCDCMAKPKEGE